jgi:hypothetical protein
VKKERKEEHRRRNPSYDGIKPSWKFQKKMEVRGRISSSLGFNILLQGCKGVRV